ncbi:undecaprenyl-diphosphatase [Bacillus sp. MUM 116]|uniref:undecaprenyl-diphosphatase n=1 Tax=Bacillus sp. MUM 116 TaxID=1678002 RepID=UPI0008F5C1BF|nr:undecaprenyl-diphosphatase [Bacillus sp. MUM 116]OIK08805.1 undecaprenyl-diphosphatase [Bacillus sp. MUM 116]
MNYNLFKSIHNLSGHNHTLDNFMVFITNDAIYIFALALIALWLFGGKSMKRAVLYAGGTGLLGLVMNVLIAKVHYEPRPFVTHHFIPLIPHSNDPSFPSDHSTGSFAIAIAMWLRNKKIGIPMFILAILTGFSRIWAGLHYPLDVLASLIVAIIVSLVTYKLSGLLDPIVNVVITVFDSIFKRKSGKHEKSQSK